MATSNHSETREPRRFGPIQIERAERDAPHDHDRDQLERVVAEGGHVRHVHQVEADRVGGHPAHGDQEEIAGECQVLDEPRVRLQHAGLAPRSFQRAVMYSPSFRLKTGRSNDSARARSALRVEPRGGPLEARHRLDQRVDRLRLEEHRGGRLGRVEPHHRLERAAARQGDRRAPGGGGLERRDAEVLDRRKDEGAAARVEPSDLGVGSPPEKADRRPGERAQSRVLRTRADDEQASAESIGRADREVDALVRHERAHDQIVVVGGLRDLEARHVDRRIDHVRRTLVYAPDPVGDVPRDRHESVARRPSSGPSA